MSNNSEKQFKVIIDSLPAAVFQFISGELSYANSAAIEFFELREYEGLSPIRALGSAPLAQAIEETLDTGNSVDLVVEVNERIMQCWTSTVDGDHTVALVALDITAVELVRRMRRDFVANASHELKTPVTGIKVMSESLSLAIERDPKRAVDMVARIQTEAERLNQLVRELLDLHRLESDGLREVEKIDLLDLSEDQVSRVSAIADLKGVTIECVVQPNISMVGLKENLKLLLSNLLTNAIQYNRPGGKASLNVRREGSIVYIIVEDTGIGIAEHHQKRIFERFYRVDKARSREAGGTGLGLSMVRHAVEQMKGSVRVSSVLGEGTTFTVMLPADGGVGNES